MQHRRTLVTGALGTGEVAIRRIAKDRAAVGLEASGFGHLLGRSHENSPAVHVASTLHLPDHWTREELEGHRAADGIAGQPYEDGVKQRPDEDGLTRAHRHPPGRDG